MGLTILRGGRGRGQGRQWAPDAGKTYPRRVYYAAQMKLHRNWGSGMDIVFLRDLRIKTVIGIFDWERRTRQTIILDLEMSADVARAAASDHIDDTLNYKAVAKRLIEFVSESEFQLVETLAERCTEIIRNEFGVRWVRLTLNKKGAVRDATDVGVIIERGERQ